MHLYSIPNQDLNLIFPSASNCSPQNTRHILQYPNLVLPIYWAFPTLVPQPHLHPLQATDSPRPVKGLQSQTNVSSLQ